MSIAYFSALLMGLTGSLHCVGMCGPIMLVMPFYQLKGARKVVGIAAYHASRILAYSLLALVLYSFRSAFTPAVQQYISIILGSVLLIAGLLSFLSVHNMPVMKMPWSGLVGKALKKYVGNPGLPAIAAAGFLNGLLPCGLVYMALSATLTLSSPLQALGFTWFFGLGTFPALLAVVLFRSRLNLLLGPSIRKFTPAIVFVFGCIFFVRGLNLGIPYLSPKTQVSNGVIHSCCHKK